ncbi:hypothetical protein BCR36DRAFT_579860 [Piromyces finnis]|uniref:Uncharacterized protein n=1 Tax=Piromyces finnis TaxID=1754191 RepID=A0A1Y1VLH0_9FUNG|nr:hypothetical protein BCR36DRAFT_579860 [Piromyces finnis]|eukprot:ORX59272.1 hypothetical protein BCR36DRAFT_579860 [Piromyces finnis]
MDSPSNNEGINIYTKDLEDNQINGTSSDYDRSKPIVNDKNSNVPIITNKDKNEKLKNSETNSIIIDSRNTDKEINTFSGSRILIDTGIYDKTIIVAYEKRENPVSISNCEDEMAIDNKETVVDRVTFNKDLNYQDNNQIHNVQDDNIRKEDNVKEENNFNEEGEGIKEENNVKENNYMEISNDSGFNSLDKYIDSTIKSLDNRVEGNQNIELYITEIDREVTETSYIKDGQVNDKLNEKFMILRMRLNIINGIIIIIII